MTDSFLSGLSVSFSGLNAERTRMQVIAENLANVNTTRQNGEKAPYQRKEVIFEEMLAAENDHAGVEVSEIISDNTPGVMEYRPGHPDADDSGYVQKPNVDPHFEMVDLLSSARTYQANLVAVRVFKDMVQRTLYLE